MASSGEQQDENDVAHTRQHSHNNESTPGHHNNARKAKLSTDRLTSKTTRARTAAWRPTRFSGTLRAVSMLARALLAIAVGYRRTPPTDAMRNLWAKVTSQRTPPSTENGQGRPTRF